MQASGRGAAAHRALIGEYESLLEKGAHAAPLFTACFNAIDLAIFEQALQIGQVMLEHATSPRPAADGGTWELLSGGSALLPK